ncbi:NDR1/HIN1-like protein 26 [Aegilops tauschii subsp. strangulata]|uniref:Late embryogenesis abundant protein LEA-2 subgroup domain-containing protein n=2 Tax=Triticinae TaxID=1648030 RepID=A0A452YY46_AEGTS|nr:NDR1/HIN1-like protein 26 [Aegilops tauschii subsp. strangulata]XP_044450040.1 NDR1/HIN1-like protein 26 [Triticum aestivum]
MVTPTPYHLLSPRTIVTKIISMKQQEPEPPKIILQPRHRTSPAMWCAAIVCFAFSVLLILVGLVILIVFLTVKPRTPSFDVAHAALNSVYIGSPPPYFNGDMTLTANISNPNHKIGVVIHSGAIELFFRGRLVSAQALPSFAQRRGQFTVLNVHMLSSQVVLPPEVAVELLNQMKSNKILYTIRGTFKVRERFWSWHYTYRMTAICDLELTAPPSGFLVDRRCTTST